MSEGNGKFIRGLFWTLVISSFAWTTFVAVSSVCAYFGHCETQKTEFTDVRKEVDNKVSEAQKAITAKLDYIIGQNTENQKTIASYARQVDVNTKRLDVIERKIR